MDCTNSKLTLSELTSGNWHLATDVHSVPLCLKSLKAAIRMRPKRAVRLIGSSGCFLPVGTSPASLFPTGCTSRTGTLKPSFLRKQIRRVLGFGGCLASQKNQNVDSANLNLLKNQTKSKCHASALTSSGCFAELETKASMNPPSECAVPNGSPAKQHRFTTAHILCPTFAGPSSFKWDAEWNSL